MTDNVFSREVRDVALSLYEGLSTPVAQECKKLLLAERWDDLALMRCVPSDYADADHYRKDAIAVSFLRKYKGLPTSIDRKAKCVETFYACEASCFRANLRLSPYLLANQADSDETISRFIRDIRKKIGFYLGRSPVLLEGRFGPGATYGDRGRLTTVPDKMSSRPTLTHRAWCHLVPWTGTLWAKACAQDGRDPEFVAGNRFTTVPKDSMKDRGICIEPSINLFYQLALGKLMKSHLLRSTGINLETASDNHRELSRVASINEELATVDLSNASDTVSYNLVKLFLEPRWFELFDSLRSPCTLIEGKTVRLEKFSSMGNGFTFELETLIFLAIASVCCDWSDVPYVYGKNLTVFGDDIILPVKALRLLESTLRFFGFDPNREKSFGDGPFRESCGGDYFRGVDVRPYFQKEIPCEPQHFIAMANGLRRLADLYDRPLPHDSPFYRAWHTCVGFIPSHIRRCIGPKDLGDIVLHEHGWESSGRWKDCIRFIRAYKPVVQKTVSWKHFKPDVVLASAVYGVGDGKLGVIPRNPLLSHHIGWVARS